MKIQRRRIERRGDYINQDWEVAHAKLPIEAHDPKAGRAASPWLTTVTDCYSRCIVGFRVEFDPPSAATVLRAFHVGMAPKQYILDRYDRGLPCWECFGMPHKLWLDRSREFESEALLAAADVFGLDLAFRTPRKRRFEGSLGDWFGRLKVHSYGDPSGLVAWEWMDRQRPAADKLPVFDMSEVTRMLTFWVIDHYHEKVHPDLRCTPSQKWRQGLRDVAPLPISPYDNMMFA